MSMPSGSDLFNIVVIGSMNPRIHHPSWYRQVGLFTAEEEQLALQDPNTFCAPPLAQLQSGGLKIVCMEQRWEAQTTTREGIPMIRRIATKTFDELLPHTPVNRFGFNFVFDRATRQPEIGAYLARCVMQTPLGVVGDDAVAAEFVIRRCKDKRTAMLTVRPGANAGSVLLATNFDYSIESAGFFNIGELIDSSFDNDLADADRQASAIVDRINSTITG